MLTILTLFGIKHLFNQNYFYRFIYHAGKLEIGNANKQQIFDIFGPFLELWSLDLLKKVVFHSFQCVRKKSQLSEI